MFTVIRLHLRAGCRTEQGQLQGVVLHADAVFAVVQHGGAVALVAQRTPPLVANLEAVDVIQAGAVRRPGHIAELDFVQAFRSPHVHREFHLQQAVQLMPVHMGHKVNPAAVRREHDILLQRGMLQFPGQMQHRPEAEILLHFQGNFLIEFDTDEFSVVI